MNTRPIAQFSSHECMGDLTTEGSFDSQAKIGHWCAWPISNMLSMGVCTCTSYHLQTSGATVAGIKCVYVVQKCNFYSIDLSCIYVSAPYWRRHQGKKYLFHFSDTFIVLWFHPKGLSRRDWWMGIFEQSQ